MEAVIFLDESGDLGWSFKAPYRNGGSSRFITIGAVKVNPTAQHFPARILKRLYKKFNWDPKLEKKWTNMKSHERMAFAKKAKELIIKEPEKISYFSITAYKPEVKEHIREDSNTLYNYLIKELLLTEMSKYSKVLFSPDPRNIKIVSGNSLHDYLQTQLYFENNATTKLVTKPRDSAYCKNVQFADMLSGLVQQHYQDQKSEPFKQLRHFINFKEYYFVEQKQQDIIATA